jgi:hypothetical protein
MRKVIVVLLVVMVAVGVAAFKFQAPAAEETTVQGVVNGQTLSNNRYPNVKFELPAEFHYAGSQRFQLYGNADAEQHFFVEADEKNVKRLFWVQYEGYLPSNNHTYDYSDQPIKFAHGGLDWLADVALSRPMGMQPSSNPPNPNSDGARFRALMKAKGYKLPAQHARIRAVALDKEKRNELMIIYIEDLALTGEKPAAAQGNEAPKPSEELQKKIAERFRERLKVSR